VSDLAGSDLSGIVGDVPPGSIDDPADDPRVECARDGCTNTFVRGPGAGAAQRKYCDDHKLKSGGTKKKGRDRRPRSTGGVNINLGGPAPRTTNKDAKAAEVEGGARAMLGLLVAGLALTGDEVCTEAWDKALPRICAQLGELSKYHPGLVTVFAPASESSETGLWLGLAMATLPAVTVTMAHHHVLPEKLAARIAGTAQAAVEAAEQAAGTEPVPADVAA
jgi:hypothetical protein